VAALLGGSAQIIHTGEPAVVPAVQRGADVVIIAAFCNAAQHRLIVRPEIKEVKDLKGKPVGITTFGSTSDYILRFALQRSGLDPNKDVSILQTGGQPEGLAAMTAGKTLGKIDVKPERLVDFSLVDELEKSGFVDAVYKE
jgi:NitT/TauT family transport system substrate-binding protein